MTYMIFQIVFIGKPLHLFFPPFVSRPIAATAIGINKPKRVEPVTAEWNWCLEKMIEFSEVV
jgi:hypothetical protein